MNCFVLGMMTTPYWESHRKRSHEPPVIELDFRVFFDSSGVQTPKVTVMRRSTCMMRFPKEKKTLEMETLVWKGEERNGNYH